MLVVAGLAIGLGLGLLSKRLWTMTLIFGGFGLVLSICIK